MNNQYSVEEIELDLDFNLEEIEQVIAPNIDRSPRDFNFMTTSIINSCRCS
jgi:hypothetical protein